MAHVHTHTIGSSARDVKQAVFVWTLCAVFDVCRLNSGVPQKSTGCCGDVGDFVIRGEAKKGVTHKR